MKKIILLILMIHIYTISNAQSLYIENVSYENCKLPIVKFKVANNEDKMFIVDSGASFSCINKDFIYDGYKIKYIKNTFNLVGFTQANPDSELKLTNTFLNDIYQIQLLAVDLSSLIESMSDKGYNIYGIIGADFLCTHNCTLDFNKRVLIINK